NEIHLAIGSDSCSTGKSRLLRDVEVLWVEESSTDGFPVLRNLRTRQAVPMPMDNWNGTDPSVLDALLGASHTTTVPAPSPKQSMPVFSEQGDASGESFGAQGG
ncbi:hypothetical protein PENTCL1PPCAC_9114, partial [Pristionchus entomophagus]